MNGSMPPINVCLTIQEMYPDIVDIPAVWIGFVSAYALVLLLGVVGNAVTGYCVLILHVNVGIHNSFVLSLMTSDLLIALLSLPFTAYSIFTREWTLPVPACKAMPIFQATGIFGSSFTLAAIAVDRYRSIRSQYIMSHSGGWKWRLVVVGCLWLLAFCASAPYAMLVMNVTQYRDLCGYFCEEVWPSGVYQRVYGLLTFAIQFLFPLIILAISYGRVEQEVQQSVRRRFTYSLTESSKNRLRERRQKAQKVMMLLFAAFVGPWLPYNALNLMRDFASLPPAAAQVTFAAVHLTAMTSLMWNPLIYCFLNEDFQKAIKQCFVDVQPDSSYQSAHLIRLKATPKHMKDEMAECRGRLCTV